MKNLLKLEELFIFFLAIYLFSLLDYAWWVYAALFFLPDIGMLGYLHNTRLGMITYNLIHHKAVCIGIYLLGALLGNPILQLAGLVLLGHSSLDRALGYGMKYADSFHNTHLGTIGKASLEAR